MAQHVPVRVSVYSSSPLFIDLSPEAFGKVFANMNSEDQAAVLLAMVDAMRQHPTQWDYIGIELDKPEFSAVRPALSAIMQEGGAA